MEKYSIAKRRCLSMDFRFKMSLFFAKIKNIRKNRSKSFAFKDLQLMMLVTWKYKLHIDQISIKTVQWFLNEKKIINNGYKVLQYIKDKVWISTI